MQIDISEIVSCENREVTEKVHIEQDTFVSRLGEFPITKSAPCLLYTSPSPRD